MLITKTLYDVLADDIQDLYSAEQHQIRALEKMKVAVSNSLVRKIFSKHLEQVRSHALRIVEAATSVRIPHDGKQCSGMMGIALDMERYIRSEACYARDIQLICTAQKMINYELVAYSSACAVTDLLKMPKVGKLLQTNLAEKKEAKAELASIGDCGSPSVQFVQPPAEIFKPRKAV